MSRTAASFVCVVALALVVAPSAEAKLCVVIDAPRTARASVPFTVRVTMFVPTWEGQRIVAREPAPATYPLRLRLRGPHGQYREARLRPTRDPAVRRSRLVLGRPGVWELTVSGWERAPRACAAAMRIRVRD